MDVFWPDGQPADYEPPYPGTAKIGLRSTSEYGYRRHPVDGDYRKHWGIDLVGVPGGIIKAPFAGVVTIAAYSGGYGNLVEITADNGDRVRLGHNKSFLVRRGQRIGAQTPVAIWDNTGSSSGTHCHYETIPRGSQAINPRSYMKRHLPPAPPLPPEEAFIMSTEVLVTVKGADNKPLADKDRRAAFVNTDSGFSCVLTWLAISDADGWAASLKQPSAVRLSDSAFDRFLSRLGGVGE